MPRYVILRHELPDDSPRASHWDFMLEQGDVLATWELHSPLSPGQTVIATQLPDHRRAYLDYEGDVSGGRGRVACWDRGRFETIEHRDGLWTLRLAGDRIQGVMEIKVDPTQAGEADLARGGEPLPPQRWLMSLLKS